MDEKRYAGGAGNGAGRGLARMMFGSWVLRFALVAPRRCDGILSFFLFPCLLWLVWLGCCLGFFLGGRNEGGSGEVGWGVV